ncbi:response regulator, partial [Parathermosynechococcus lividus]
MTNSNANVLIVDDNEMNRDTLARRLRQQGFAIEMAANGVEALEMARKQSYDLVLLDIMMPEMDGYEVLQTMKADSNLRHIPVIMISALEEIESVMKCMELGAEDYLTKPFDPVLLKAAIARCLKKAPPRAATPAPTRT